MECPNCKSDNFAKYRIFLNAENYGGGVYIDNCRVCNKKLRIVARRRVHLISVEEASEDAEYSW